MANREFLARGSAVLKMPNETKPDRHYKIGYIREGIVMDHLPPKTAIKILTVLGLKETTHGLVTMAMNLDTKKNVSGKKDLVKIERKTLTKEELNKVALIAPNAVVNIIRDSRVVKKLIVEIPDIIENVIKCNNPNCITQSTGGLSKFIKEKDGEKLKCHYCEKSFGLDEIGLL